MKKGLVSITFRNKTPEEIVDLVKKSGLEAIEWGGDIHVPHGNIEIAKHVGEITRNAGLEVAAYGSYYNYYDESITAEDTVNSAVALGAKIIRVWAGKKNFDETTSDERKIIYDNLSKAVELASKHGIVVATEFHPNTLTNTPEGCEETLANVSGLKTYWQPLYDRTLEVECELIKRFGTEIVNSHMPAFNTLSAISDRVGIYVDHLKKYTNASAVMIEFVKDDSDEQYMEDANILKNS